MIDKMRKSELSEGYEEVEKYGMIERKDLLEWIEEKWKEVL